MAEINRVVRRIEHQFVHADYVSFSKGRNLDFYVRTQLQQFLHRRGAPRGCIFLVGMMALINVRTVIVPQGRLGSSDQFEKKIHSYREIGAKKKSGLSAAHLLANIVDFRVPPRSPPNHTFPSGQNRVNIVEDALWSGEINDNVNCPELLRS